MWLERVDGWCDGKEVIVDVDVPEGNRRPGYVCETTAISAISLDARQLVFFNGQTNMQAESSL